MTSENSKCHAGRNLPAGNRRMRDGAGHWLVAYREAQEQSCRRIQPKTRRSSRKSKNGAARIQCGFTLDASFLLQLYGADKPSELHSVDISERNLTCVNSKDFEVFDNVASIDASVNSLSLGSFNSFRSLRELSLALNGISNVTFDAAEFPYLEVLDLSFNNVSAHGFESLGRLPGLRVLHLTGNQLCCLPPRLDSNQQPSQLAAEEENAPFRSLEVLMLDDNKLSSDVFSSLIHLKKLRHLNLKGNHISEIPHVELMRSSKPLPVSTEAQKEALARSGSDPNTDGHLKIISLVLQQDDWEERCEEHEQPLPELQVLNLASNKIAKEEVLIAAALFPMLHEIDIQSNPLTTQRRGDAPLLMYLQEKLGITIKCKKTEEVRKIPLTPSTYLKWKVEDNVPKVSKKSQLMNASCPTRSLSPADRRNPPAAPERGVHQRPVSPEHTEQLFITQAADVPELDVLSEDKESAEENRHKMKQIADFKMFLNVKPLPDASKPIGFRPAIRMLKHKLNNLNVYRDSKPRLDSIQKPYREKEKRIKELPPLRATRNPGVRAEEMMRELKSRSTMRVVALDGAVHGDQDECKEARSLLEDLKKKYRLAYEKAVEDVAGVESDAS